MKILFIHQNFPGQFCHLSVKLLELGHEVLALRLGPAGIYDYKGVKVVQYSPNRSSTRGIHPWLIDLESQVIRGEAAFHACLELNKSGYSPDLIVAHPGWGETLFIKNIWPNAISAMYAEFYYNLHGFDVGFDPEFDAPDEDENCRLMLKNTNQSMQLSSFDAAISPTAWQKSSYPKNFQDKISIIHDGINTNSLVPLNDVALTINGTQHLKKGQKILTFVNRNLEPTRGYHTFMRSLPEVIRKHPDVTVLIVGNSKKGYGKVNAGKSWKDVFFDEIKDELSKQEIERIKFLGHIEYSLFIKVLQISMVHVYLTYPFVLSWSMLEAMSIACPIIASDTEPVKEIITDNQNGILVDFFDHHDLAGKIDRLFNDAALRDKIGLGARIHAVKHYDLEKICLPAQVDWINSIVS